MPIEADIHELLYDHDCVIVPGFGGFITHYRSARIDHVRRMIHPPGTDLSFNRKLTRNDGLLADRVAKRKASGHTDALAAMAGEVEGWKSRIDGEGRMELRGIGTFFHDPERNLQFEPGREVNFLKDALGLKPMAAIPVLRIQHSTKTTAVVRHTTLVEGDTGARVPMLWAAAAVTAVLFGAGAWFTWQQVDGGGAQWSGLGPLLASEPTSYTVRERQPAEVEPATAESDWSPPIDVFGVHPFAIAGADGPMVVVDLGVAPMAVPESTAVATAVEPNSVSGRFHVIGGCFSVAHNAERMIADLRARGSDARLLDVHRGLHRVAIGSYSDRSVALDVLAAVRKEGQPDAWLLIK